jgi:NAD(P)-dependent dehydrogenase (short-subunit alcohol dehydrogenase family)
MGSIRNFAAFVGSKYQKIDVLINNAAVVRRERAVSADGHELMFATNHLGPFLLTNLLRDLLQAAGPARILNITAPSTTEPNFKDLDGRESFNYLNAFGASKMMNLLFTFELARRIEGTGMTCNAIHPGLARSNLMREAAPFLRLFLWMVSASPQRAGDHIARVALLPGFAKLNGKFLHKGKEIRAPAYAHDREAQRKLWEISAEMTGPGKEAFDG